MNPFSWPVLGCGVGLRNEHYQHVISQGPQVDWFEAVSENFMDSGGRPVRILEKVRERYPVVLHGTSLSISSKDPLEPGYLDRLKKLVERIQPAMVSDHLCWTGVGGQKLHDLLPVPYTEEALNWIAGRVRQVQDFLGRRILLENVSTYITYQHSEMTEWEFLSEVSRRADCGILLDLNNVYVNAFNHGFNALDYLNYLPAERIGQFHLAGHTDKGDYLFDTHSAPVIDPVWDLYSEALKRWGKIPTLIEWDENLPPFEELLRECHRARDFYDSAPARLELHPEPVVISPKQKVSEEPSLIEVQHWMKAAIRPEADKGHRKIKLNLQRGVPGNERLKVYADGYLGRMHESLGEVYPAVHHLTGDKNFFRLARDYAAAVPSTHYNLSRAGHALPEFLEKWPLTRELGFLPDLARLEWKISLSFHAFDPEKKLDLEALGGLTPDQWEQTRLIFHPSVHLFASQWPVLELWKARLTDVENIRVALEGRAESVLVYRKETEVFCLLLQPLQYTVLEAIAAGNSIARIFESLQDQLDGIQIQAWFGEWVGLGLFCDFEAVSAAGTPAI